MLDRFHDDRKRFDTISVTMHCSAVTLSANSHYNAIILL